MVKVKLPPPQRNVNPQIQILPANTKLRRIFDPTRFNATPTGFRSYGPVSRFDHHSSNEPTEDPERRIIYAGFSLSCCIAEYFGDGEIINVENIKLAIIYLGRELKLLDLRGKAAMGAGTVTAISAITQREITQAWGRYFYEHIELYDRVDGLIFSGAHNGEDAIALYERVESTINSSKVKVIDLGSETLKSTILKIAEEHGFDVET
ncbi:RES family NAD+ phosphorylase [Myxosarcina sp. GI1]|uniref:RES family NAD+ phosphorylase n=1 Tax=Myxosarcina sp. GI1 TaxID=1541065 RepID=UPI000565F5E6|nr:RES family NAD+ phosphorylase [Myxosarcina sp. GI1]